MKIDAKMPAHVDLILSNASHFFNWSDTLAAHHPQFYYDAVLGFLNVCYLGLQLFVTELFIFCGLHSVRPLRIYPLKVCLTMRGTPRPPGIDLEIHSRIGISCRDRKSAGAFYEHVLIFFSAILLFFYGFFIVLIQIRTCGAALVIMQL